ncbi:MAG: ankyrin repeat domain-containing protein [Bryobacteraceae bacterium]|nr:ankyrin repeat domain-containing protein [Bryobacteraceae bacterium]
MALYLSLAGMACGVLPNARFGNENMTSAEFFESPSMIAAATAVEKQDIAALEGMARAGLDVNRPGKHGMTLLIWSLNGQKKRSLEKLLALRADPNAKLESGDTAVAFAAAAKDIGMLRLLLDHGGDPNALNRDGSPATFGALDRRLWDNYELLMAHGADPEAKNRMGQTALVRMAVLECFDYVATLLDRGASIRDVDNAGATVAWYVQDSRVGSDAGQREARDRVMKMLEQRGVKFPVALHPVRKP